MAYTTINKHTAHFNTKLYTGNGSTNAITGVGFQPDLVWLKSRSATWDHEWYDAVRGAGYSISSVTANAEGSSPQGVTAFGSDGFTVGTRSGANQSGQTYVAWNWKANGTGSANTDGSINSTVSANTTSGFSIVTYTGNGTANSTVGHGLGTIPEFIIVKGRSAGGTAWGTKNPAYNSPSDPNVIYLNNNSGTDSAQNVWGTSAAFTTSTFTVGDWVGSNSNSTTYVAYCFSSKTGYSKFGSYTGNGSTDGTFVYTGFKPAFILIRRKDSGDNWMIHDDKREGYNPANDELMANLSNVEQAYDTIDLLSNGFKLRHTAGRSNNSGGTYIYMAFGQSLVGSNNVPCTAR